MKPKLTRLVPATPSLLETNLHSFTYETLEKATRGFSEEIGRGSSGVVYKGQLEAASCNLMIAIKRLDRLAQERDKEFRTELSAIGKTSHKNLVRLIGFCDEGIHRLLMYEFMRWLVYLHEECDAPIIHCDIKPKKVLVHEHFNARV